MDSYHIEGGKTLCGEHTPKGAKNAALPILAATILTGKTSEIFNCPDISDVLHMESILREIGCKVWHGKDKVVVDSQGVNCNMISEKLMKEMRSSVFIMGPMLARCGEVVISRPGGCEIGERPIDMHIGALEKLGALVERQGDYIKCSAKRLKGCVIDLPFPSVGATENTMLAALAAEGETVINNCAAEPEIVDLQSYLISCGAKIKGAGTSTIIAEGTNIFRETSHSIVSDRIECGTILMAVAATGGEVELKKACGNHLEIILQKLLETGCKVVMEKDRIYLSAPKTLKGINFTQTGPYPGFPTDMQSQLLALLSMAEGASRITENIFENRFKPVLELVRMGAKIAVEDRTAIVQGRRLTGKEVVAKDLRGGAALVIAGLGAQGITIVRNVSHIERGYEDLARDLNRLGGCIHKR